MENDYIIISGYKFKKQKNIKKLLKSLFTSEQAICALDSNGVIYISDSKNHFIKPKEPVLDFYDYLNSLDIIDKDIKTHLIKLYNDFNNEQSLIDEDLYKVKIKLRDFNIKLKDFKNEFKVTVELTIYENNFFTFIFNIKIPKNTNYIKFQHSLLYQTLDYISLPNQYLDYSKVDYTPNKGEIVRDMTPYYFNNYISNFSNIINNNYTPYIELKRSSIFINQKSIKKQDTYKLLYQSIIDIKENTELKDYRIANDYYHYSDQSLSVLIGENVSSEINWITILDTIIIHDLLNDSAYLNNIYDNTYSLKELLQIQEEYERKSSFKNHFPLIEGNDYINSIFNLLNKNDVNNVISNAIERKKEDKQNKKELVLSILGCILAVPTLYDYIFEPLLLWIYNLNEDENILLTIPTPYNILIVSILLILSLLILITIFYTIENKKE